MTTRIRTARRALAPIALAALALTMSASDQARAAKTVTAHLRVLTPDRVLDPGTSYIVDRKVEVPTRGDADCFGAPGGSGASYSYDKPNALSLLATAGRTTRAVRPLQLTDQFGFGLGICGIGGAEASLGESFWYLKVNHREATVGADQVQLRKGDDVLFYLAPDAFPDPNPPELELRAPAGVVAGEPFSVSVVQHSCVTQSDPPYETQCSSGPAAGVAVSGADAAATTGADGRAELSVRDVGVVQLSADRAGAIPSETLQTCVGPQARSCPDERGISLVGSPRPDRIKGTAGDDTIRSRGGDDRIDLRKGGVDWVKCGGGRDLVRLSRRFDNDGIVIKGSCERIKRT